MFGEKIENKSMIISRGAFVARTRTAKKYMRGFRSHTFSHETYRFVAYLASYCMHTHNSGHSSEAISRNDAAMLYPDFCQFSREN